MPLDSDEVWGKKLGFDGWKDIATKPVSDAPKYMSFEDVKRKWIEGGRIPAELAKVPSYTSFKESDRREIVLHGYVIGYALKQAGKWIFEPMPGFGYDREQLENILAEIIILNRPAAAPKPFSNTRPLPSRSE